MYHMTLVLHLEINKRVLLYFVKLYELFQGTNGILKNSKSGTSSDKARGPFDFSSFNASFEIPQVLYPSIRSLFLSFSNSLFIFISRSICFSSKGSIEHALTFLSVLTLQRDEDDDCVSVSIASSLTSASCLHMHKRCSSFARKFFRSLRSFLASDDCGGVSSNFCSFGFFLFSNHFHKDQAWQTTPYFDKLSLITLLSPKNSFSSPFCFQHSTSF